MPKKKFILPEIDESGIENAKGYLSNIFFNLKSKFKNFHDFQNVILNYDAYHSELVVNEQKPEQLVKETILEPILKYLGFSWSGETIIKSPFGTRSPDYTISSSGGQDLVLYVEAEPMNTNLYAKNRGRSQIFQWLLSKAAKTEYGLATDGLLWILVKFEESSNQIKDIQKVDLRPFFSSLLNPGLCISEGAIREELTKLILLRPENLRKLIHDFLTSAEEEKEEVTQRFYNEYVRYVFGLKNDGISTGEMCLLNSITISPSVKNARKELFAVVTMNRLLFITFLDEKGIVHKNLLSGLYEQYKRSHPTETFYSTRLKPLFYEVFNKEPKNRNNIVRSDDLYGKIPYLNGGLFRETFENEGECDINNEGVELVLYNLLNYNLLKDYTIGLSEESELKPEILGYIFEKTINYISGTGTNQQKMQGAYYTPEDVVNFIIDETLNKKILDRMLQGLRNAKWQKKDLAGYNTIEDILHNMPSNPKHCYMMLNEMDSIRVIDPACGSGHFLTTAANVLTRAQASILLAMGENPDLYEIKRKVISYNIFGTDIDEIAVEIAKLRLWLSLISEVKETEHTRTLPNIDFNILSGNALIGQMNEKLTLSLTNTGMAFIEPDDLEDLNHILGQEKREILKLLNSNKTDDLSRAYQKLLSKYRLESGEHAVWVHDVLGKIRKKLYAAFNDAYYAYIIGNGERARGVSGVVWNAVTSGKPFHWAFDFVSVLEDGGFDVVIGNPPYIEDSNYTKSDLSIIKSLRKSSLGMVPLSYQSMHCGNTHAYFIERSMNLLRNSGKFGFIVPVSLVSTDRMGPIREIIHGVSSYVAYYNFDDRPGKIFSGIEHCRSTIVITTKGEGVKEVLTSRYHRWYTEDRPSLFNNLGSVRYSLSDTRQIIPKIGSKMELEIINKILRQSGGKTMSQFIGGGGEEVWYHNAPQYWIHAHTEGYVPSVEYYKQYTVKDGTKEIILGQMDNRKVTDHYKFVETNNQDFPVITALLNSSLFYWWFIIYSDGRDLLPQHIATVPIDLASVKGGIRNDLTELVKRLMTDYERNSNIKINVRKNGYAIKIKEIIPKKSYSVLREIDEKICEIYDLNEKEIGFIRNFDIKFRIGKNNDENVDDNYSR